MGAAGTPPAFLNFLPCFACGACAVAPLPKLSDFPDLGTFILVGATPQSEAFTQLRVRWPIWPVVAECSFPLGSRVGAPWITETDHTENLAISVILINANK